MTEPRVWAAEAIRYGQDPDSGAEVEQLTSQPVTSTNIYCEQRYASADGQRIAITRTPFGRPTELWVCDLRSLRVTQVAEAVPVAANASRNAIYCATPTGSDARRLLRLDLADLTIRPVLEFDGLPPAGGAVTADERWFVDGLFPVRDNVYRLRRTDLVSGKSDTLCEIEDASGHMQFDPAGSGQTIIQINRGRQRDPVTGRDILTGPLGATLSVVDVETGKVSPLPVGRPHTPPISGHECWAGTSGRILFTAGQYQVTASAYVTLGNPPDDERRMPRAALYSVAPGESSARVVAEDLLFNHLAASDDGRFFIADDHTTGAIHIGHIATGRHRRLCESRTRQGLCQYSHVHAYLTPDNRHVIFNSIATGVGQVYAARVPDGFLDGVSKL